MMLFHVGFEAFDTIVGADVPALRQAVGSWLARVAETGALKEHGIFVGKRAGFFLLEAKSNEELFGLIGHMVDWGKVTVDPVISPNVLGEYFRNNPWV
jgi:hypothetical protein